jgi:hypothetical protein
MITYRRRKVTATELAKLYIEDRGSLALGCWPEFDEEAWERMTEKERGAVSTAIERHLERVRTFLGFWDLHEKVIARPGVGEP